MKYELFCLHWIFNLSMLKKECYMKIVLCVFIGQSYQTLGSNSGTTTLSLVESDYQ